MAATKLAETGESSNSAKKAVASQGNATYELPW